MANAVKTLSTSSRLKVAHKALVRVKSKYSLEEFDETQEGIQVSYYDQFDNWSEETIERQELTAFILDFYSQVQDSCLGGEHLQYEDTHSTEYYLDENMKKVLTDYLNNRKS